MSFLPEEQNLDLPAAQWGRWAGLGFAMVFPTFVTLAYFVWLKDFPARQQQTAYLIGKTLQFGFPLVWSLWVLRERFPKPRWSLAGVPFGVGFGALIGSATLLLYQFWLAPAGWLIEATQMVLLKVRGMELDTPAKYLWLGVFYSLGHSLLEEYYWRWFVFRELRRLVPLSAAIVASSLGFTAHHVILLVTYFGWFHPATWLLSISIFVGGMVWCWLYHRSRSLLGPWLSHILVDAAIFTVGYQMVRGEWG